MTMTLRTALGAASLAALLAAGAIAPAFAAKPAEGETLADSQTFTWQIIDEIGTLDPGKIETVDDSDIARQLFEGLMNQDAQGNVVPGVATGYEVSEDGLTYTFTLRPEAMWSDGTPVTANDFVYAWRRAADPATASPYSWYIELMGIKGASAIVAGEAAPDTLGVEAKDDHTFVVTLDAPKPYFPQMVTHTTTYPVPQAAIEAHGDAWTQPGNLVGNGAYVLSERVPQERVTLTRNDKYWNNAETVIESVTALVINDDVASLARYDTGELDRTAVPVGQFPRYMEERPDETTAVPLLCTYFYHINMRDTATEALKDLRVREALSLAVDRDILVDNILAGGQEAAYTYAHSAIAGWEVPPVAAAGMTQDERNARAQELMAEAGYGTDGEPLTLNLIYNTSDAHAQLAVAIAQMWKQTLGVETTLLNQEWQTFLDTRKNGDYDLARAGWCADYNEASTFLDTFTSNSDANDSAYMNPEYDALLTSAATADDPNADYIAAEELLARDVPLIPLYFYTSNFLLKTDVQGWPYENASANWYAKDLYRIAE